MRRGSGILCLLTSVLWYGLQLLWSSVTAFDPDASWRGR